MFLMIILMLEHYQRKVNKDNNKFLWLVHNKYKLKKFK